MLDMRMFAHHSPASIERPSSSCVFSSGNVDFNFASAPSLSLFSKLSSPDCV